MNENEARKVAEILRSADGFCTVCAEELAKQMGEVFPEHDWLSLIEYEPSVRQEKR